MTQPNSAPKTPISIHTLKKGLPAQRATRTKVLVRIVAPERPVSDQINNTPRRAPVDLAIVIDRSGSMTGKPLAAAIGCARNLIKSLSNDDRVAIVTFDDEIQVLQPLAGLSEREVLYTKLSGVEAGGSTALFDGWKEGAKQLAPFTSAKRTSRVILLTDGQANKGLVDTAAIAEQVAELARSGVTTSTVGLGTEFNESLLTKMADAGEGQAHYGQTPEDLEDSFAEEFQILNKAWLRKVTLSVTAGTGVVANILKRDGSKDAEVKLGTLPYGAALDAVVQLDIGVHRQSSSLISAYASAIDIDGKAVNLGPVILSLPELDAETLDALPDDEIVKAAVAESDLADEFLRIHKLASTGKIAEAIAAIKELKARPGATAWAERTAKYIVNLADEDLESAIKELSYSSRAFRGRTREAEAFVAYSSNYNVSVENSKDVFLAKKLGAGRSQRRSAREENPGESI